MPGMLIGFFVFMILGWLFLKLFFSLSWLLLKVIAIICFGLPVLILTFIFGLTLFPMIVIGAGLLLAGGLFRMARK